MIATWKQYEGQAVDGIPLLRLLGGGEANAVYLGELAGAQCAIKLVRVDEAAAQIPLARWQQASKFGHPHLTRIHQWGRARLNGDSLVYLAMEFAEEVLDAVDRPLTAKEAREMLTPAVAALLYLHGQKFAHGRIRPSNILSVADTLKISGDAPLRFGERHTARSSPSPYDPPELPNTGVTAAGDVWSLGATLVESLTKQFPVVEGDVVSLPDGLKPDTFREVAAGCLRRDPAQRWSILDLSQWLERGVLPAPKRAPRRYLVPAAVAAAVVAAGAIALPHFTGGSKNTLVSSQPEASSTAPAVAPPAPPVEVAPTPAPAPKASQTTAPKSKTKPAPVTAPSMPPVVTEAPQPSKPKTAPAPAPVEASATPSTPAATGPAPSDSIPPEVVASVRPDPIPKARNSVHGKVPISIRVETDASGAVTDAKIESGGSSKYFADLSLKTARQWKFAPSEGPHLWMLRFEFTHTNGPVSMQASRLK